jgi:hypothetical protein
MAVLENGTYLLSRNAHPFDLVVWNGAASITIIADTGSGSAAQNTFGGYMMGTLDAPAPISLAIGQPGGSGTFRVSTSGLLTGTDSFHVMSLEPAPGGPGSGPYLGLHTAFPANLIAQVALPRGALPFHFTAVRPTFSFQIAAGVPPGLTVEMIALEVTGGTLGRVSPVATVTTF